MLAKPFDSAELNRTVSLAGFRWKEQHPRPYQSGGWGSVAMEDRLLV